MKRRRRQQYRGEEGGGNPQERKPTLEGIKAPSPLAAYLLLRGIKIGNYKETCG